MCLKRAIEGKAAVETLSEPGLQALLESAVCTCLARVYLYGFEPMT